MSAALPSKLLGRASPLSPSFDSQRKTRVTNRLHNTNPSPSLRYVADVVDMEYHFHVLSPHVVLCGTLMEHLGGSNPDSFAHIFSLTLGCITW